MSEILKKFIQNHTILQRCSKEHQEAINNELARIEALEIAFEMACERLEDKDLVLYAEHIEGYDDPADIWTAEQWKTLLMTRAEARVKK